MKLTGIESLYKDMRSKNIDRYKFDFKYAEVEFDIIFFIDEKPFILMFGVKKSNFYFEIEIKNGYTIIPYFEKKVYDTLIKLFKFEDRGNDVFKPIYFFETLNERIPKFAIKKNIAKPSEIARYRRDVEESDKIYFWGWIDHEKNRSENHDYKGNVSDKNLEKTRKLLGYKAYLRCKEKNISSKWTDDESKEIEYTLENSDK